MFITFEGPDGAGKSTQIRNLQALLESRGYDVLLTREPGDTPQGQVIRDLLLNPKYTGITPVTEAMLYAADRAQHVHDVIRPALEQGRAVICDRYVDSTMAYQLYGRQLPGELMNTLAEYATDGIMPDATVILTLDRAEAEKRFRSRASADRGDYGAPDRLEAERDDFRDRVNRGFEQIAADEPGRVVRIDASGTVEQVWDLIRRGLEDRGII